MGEVVLGERLSSIHALSLDADHNQIPTSSITWQRQTPHIYAYHIYVSESGLKKAIIKSLIISGTDRK